MPLRQQMGRRQPILACLLRIDHCAVVCTSQSNHDAHDPTPPKHTGKPAMVQASPPPTTPGAKGRTTNSGLHPPPLPARRSSWGSPGSHVNTNPNINPTTAAATTSSTPPRTGTGRTPATTIATPPSSSLVRASATRRRSLDSSLPTAGGPGSGGCCSFQQQRQLRAEQQEEWRRLFGEPISPDKATVAAARAALAASSASASSAASPARSGGAVATASMPVAASTATMTKVVVATADHQKHGNQPAVTRATTDARVTQPPPPSPPQQQHASQPQQPRQQQQQQQQVPLRPLGPYFLGRTLGVGTFGKVVRGIHALTGEKVWTECGVLTG